MGNRKFLLLIGLLLFILTATADDSIRIRSCRPINGVQKDCPSSFCKTYQ